MMLVATVLLVGGNCFNSLVAQQVVGELQMVCSAWVLCARADHRRCCCSWDLVSVDSLDDVASTLLLRNCAQGVALFAQWLAGCIQSLRNAEYNGRSSVRMSACACG